MQVKVRHALVNYTIPGRNSKGDTIALDEIALRGEVVDIPDDQVQRLKDLGAVIAADAELERPGTLLQLPESPSDEEIIAWVRSASPAEMQALANTRAELIPRLAGAKERVERDYQRQMELLGHAARERGAEPDQGTPAGDPDGSGDGTTTDDADTTPADEVVKRNAEEVAAFVALNPGRASDIMDAEVRRTNGKPRRDVVNAVEAAVEHS